MLCVQVPGQTGMQMPDCPSSAQRWSTKLQVPQLLLTLQSVLQNGERVSKEGVLSPGPRFDWEGVEDRQAVRSLPGVGGHQAVSSAAAADTPERAADW